MGSWTVRALAVVFASAFLVAPAEGSRQPQAANPTWSADGTRIAFAEVGIPRGRVEVMSAADGSGKHPIFAADSCCEPIIWAAGRRVAFISNFTLFTAPAGGGKPTQLFKGSTPWFIVSPNRETVALDDGCGCGHAPDSIALAAVRGGKPFVVPRPKNASDSIDGFSPDGTQLVFTRAPWSYNGNPKGKPVIMDERVRGGPPVPLSRSGLIGAAYVPADAVWPQWSPDGKWIAFIAPGAKPKLELVSTAGGSPTVLVPKLNGPSSFSWSPASDRLAYTVYSSARGHLEAVDLHGTNTIVSGSLDWVSNDSWDRPQWSPDGKRLVFMTRGGGVWIVGADDTGLKQVA